MEEDASHRWNILSSTLILIPNWATCTRRERTCGVISVRVVLPTHCDKPQPNLSSWTYAKLAFLSYQPQSEEIKTKKKVRRTKSWKVTSQHFTFPPQEYILWVSISAPRYPQDNLWLPTRGSNTKTDDKLPIAASQEFSGASHPIFSSSSSSWLQEAHSCLYFTHPDSLPDKYRVRWEEKGGKYRKPLTS